MNDDYSVPLGILVVGPDELQRVATGLSAASHDWQIAAISDAAEALKLVQGDAIDAVVTDSSNGELLDELRSTHPHVARILVADNVGRSGVMPGNQLAHVVVPIACEAADLKTFIERSVALRARLDDSALRDLLDGIGTLPSPPAVVQELGYALRNPDAVVDDVAVIVEADVAMTAKLLKFINSAAFGLNHHITDTRQAIAYLGLQQVYDLLAATALNDAFKPETAELGQAIEALHDHSLAVAELARSLVVERFDKAAAFTAGLMHDVGLLALIGCAPNHYLALREEIVHGERELESAELDVLGTSHASIGAYVLERWGFPQILIESVGRSHDADAAPHALPKVVQAVFLAEQLTNMNDTEWWESSRMPELDYLQQYGWNDILDREDVGN